MQQNPSLQVGIDGSMDPRGTDPRNQDLSNRRVGAVRDALIQAGVPAYRIQRAPSVTHGSRATVESRC